MPVAVLLGETAAGRPTVPRLVPAAAAACLPFNSKLSTPRASAPIDEPSHSPTARLPKYASELQEEHVAALPAFLEQQWLRTDVPGVPLSSARR